MKKIIFYFVCFAAGVAVALAVMSFKCQSKEEKAAVPALAVSSDSGKAPVIRGYGYIRGRSRTSLYNKYGAYVKKVYFYSNARVKKGDCILEYDDFDLPRSFVLADFGKDKRIYLSRISTQGLKLRFKENYDIKTD